MQHRLSHRDVLIRPAGFKISTLHPFIGASPDGYVSCSCCGTGVIEIKCPFSAKDLSISEAVQSVGHFCLEQDSQGKIKVKRDHAYFHQVQMQLFVTKCDYCDFILWTKKDDSLCVERITFDSEFFQKELELARTFFIKCIIPELLGKWFSAPKQATANTNPQQQWCYCRAPAAGNMLVCASGFCAVEKFHQTCLRMKRVPKQWVCPSCRKLINAPQKKP